MGAPVPLGALVASQENRRVGSPIVTPARHGAGGETLALWCASHSRCGPAVPPLRGPSGLLEGVPLVGVAGTEVLGLWGSPRLMRRAAKWVRSQRPCLGVASRGTPWWR